MSYTPFQAPFNAGLLGDDEIAAHFSLRAELEAMLSFEAALVEAQAEAGVIEAGAAEAIVEALPRFRPDMDDLREGGARDGMIVPALIRQLRAHVGEHGALLHHGSTSQDVIDTAAMMRLRDAVGDLSERLAGLVATLEALRERVGEREVMARTRMQAALPVPLGVRLDNWLAVIASVADTAPQRFPVQFGGPVGVSDRAGGQAVALGVAERLGLTCPARHWQTDRMPMVEIAQWLANVCGALGKIGADVCLMALMGEVSVSDAGGSSAMAHKRNPVKAEALVTLARFAAPLAGTMGQALVHENERSGAMWTLEWLVMPQLAVATGAATRNALALVQSLDFD